MNKSFLKIGIVFLVCIAFTFPILKRASLERQILHDYEVLQKLEAITDPKTLKRIHHLGQKYGYGEVYTTLTTEQIFGSQAEHSYNSPPQNTEKSNSPTEGQNRI
ncbi:MAG: hypothetical protein BGO76_00900 [Caedibacter sp. 38-128]|nr:hypothetical protein [Holosporales bacterium]OJX03403.1 MAG: hypothetical protein BGO76_00900 [Caedibacter sp. 38-128]